MCKPNECRRYFYTGFKINSLYRHCKLTFILVSATISKNPVKVNAQSSFFETLLKEGSHSCFEPGYLNLTYETCLQCICFRMYWL